MYVVRKVNDIHEEFVVENIKGEIELSLPVNIAIDTVLASYNRLRKILGEAQENLRQKPECSEYQEYYGKVFVELLKVIFGEEGCTRLLECYENKYDKLLSDVAPFIVECIQPQMHAAMIARAERYKALSKQVNHAQHQSKKLGINRWFK